MEGISLYVTTVFSYTTTYKILLLSASIHIVYSLVLGHKFYYELHKFYLEKLKTYLIISSNNDYYR